MEEYNKEQFEQLAIKITKSTDIKQKNYIKEFQSLYDSNQKNQSNILQIFIGCLNSNRCYDLSTKIRAIKLIYNLIQRKEIDKELVLNASKACLNQMNKEISVDELIRLNKKQKKFLNLQSKIMILIDENCLEILIQQSMNDNKKLYYLIYLLQNKKNFNEIFKEIIQKKILSECLLEKKSKAQQQQLKYISLFNQFINQDFFNTEMYPIITKSLRRNENNIEVINDLFEQQINIDLSNQAEELIFQILKDYLFSSKIKQMIIFVVREIIQRISNQSMIEKILNMFINLIDKTIDENQKIILFQIFSGFNFHLIKAPEIQPLLSYFYLSNVLTIAQDESIEIYSQILDNFIEGSNNLILTEKQINSLKKVLASTNKSALLIVSNFLISYLKKYGKQEYCQCIKSLIPCANSSLLINQLKQSSKLVTNYQILLAGLNICSYSQNLQKDYLIDKNLNYQQIFNQLLSDIYVNQQKFFQKVGANDLMNYISALLRFSKKFNEIIKPGDKKYLILAHTLIQCLLHPLCKLNQMLKLIDESIERNYVMQLIIYGLFMKTSCLEFSDCKESEKFRILITFIIKNFEYVNFDEINLFALISIIYHPNCNLKIKYSTRFLQKIKQLNLFEKMQLKLKDQQQNLFYYFISPIESTGEINFNLRQNIFKVFIDFNVLEIYDNYKVFITESNFIEEVFLEQFEKDLNDRIQYCFDIFYPIEEYLMQFQFINKKLFNFEQILEKQQKNSSQKQQQGGKKKKGNQQQSMQKGKPKKKVQEKEKKIIMDEQEIAQMKLNQLQDKMTYYFRIIIKYYELLVAANNIKYQEYFFNNYYELLIELAENKLLKGLILSFLVTYFKQKNITRNYAICLAEQFLRKNEFINSEDYPISEKTEKQLIQFIKKLLEQWNENEKEFVIEIYNEIAQFIIDSNDFCLQLKELAMQLLFNIIRYDQKGNFKDQIFDLIIKNINRICYFQKAQIFVDFLLNKLDLNDNKYLKSIFNDILNNCECGQQILLVSLNKLPQIIDNSKSKIKFTFELFIKLKILNENPEQTQQIIQLSECLLKNQGEIEFSQEEIENFDLNQFFQNTSKEEIELFSKICANLFKNNQEQCQLMMNNVIILSNQIVSDEFNEDNILFFPDFFLQTIQQIDNKFFKPIYSLIIEKCCHNEDDQILIKLCMQLGIQIIKIYGEQYNKELTEIIEYYLQNKNEGINKSVAVVFIGICAPFIQDNVKLDTIQKKIIGLFETGSETLQKTLSQCVIDLMIFFENPEQIIRNNLIAIESNNNSQIQRGAAYLIGGLIKGLGINYLEKYGILVQIEQLMIKKENNKNGRVISIGVLYLMIALMENLGKIFEPYIQQIIIHLMNFFGDSNEEIRNLSLRATQNAMYNLSAYGVQLLLPILLKGINEQQNWRAKLANIEALGNMAYCSPKQLSTCLPQIIPKLTNTLTDTHPKVRESANQALTVIGSTIKNPEISEIVQILILALSDPFYQNYKGLDILLKTQFVHYVDIPALSLIIPIIDYGLRSRDSLLKEKASRIAGTILHLIKDPRDLMPYLETVVNALIIAITDPLTEVRNIAAKACGCLSKKIGMLSEGLISQLEQILQSEKGSSNEKAGAAQGLCEAVWNIGEEYFIKKLPEFLERTQSKVWSERDAYIGLFVFFPVLMEEKFEKYMRGVLEFIGDGIQEENESTRNKVIRILKICIMKYGLSNTELLLGPIREGMLNDQWRKRNGAIIIFGDLVETVKKKQKESECEEGEEIGAKKDRILKHYIPDFDELLITIHVLKYDLFDQSKIQATGVWKANVDNTPKIIKRQLVLLIAKLIEMSVGCDDIKLIATNCIDDFCNKYFETTIQQIFQILLAKAEEYRRNPSLLNGTYLIMGQFLGRTNKEILRKNQEIIQQILEINIESKEDKLRQSIYACLKQYLHLLQWPKYQQPVLERIISPLTESIEIININSEEYTDLIRCFNDLVATKSETIFNYLTPFLLKTPMSVAKVDILANNAEFIGPEIYGSENLEMTMLFLFNQLFEAKEKELREQLLYCINQLSINLAKEYAQNFISDGIELLKDFQENQESLDKSLLVLQVFNYYFYYSTFDYQQLITELLEQFVGFLFIENQESSKLLNQIMKNLLNIQDCELSDQALHELVNLLQYELETTELKNNEIFAFNQPDGIEPYIQLIIKGMAFGMQSTINDAIDLCEIIFKYSKIESVQEFILKLTGVFIRVCNYRLSLSQKTKLLTILYKLQTQESFNGVMNMFQSQLQATYMRILYDYPYNDQYQQLVVKNFMDLVKFISRKDFLLNECINKFQNSITAYSRLIYIKFAYNNLKYNFNLFSLQTIQSIFEQISSQFELIFKFDEAETKEEEEEYLEYKNQIDTNLIVSVAKVIGQSSNAIQIDTVQKFINQQLDCLKDEYKDDSATSNKQLLSCLSILSIYNYHKKEGEVFQGKQIMKQILQSFFEAVLTPEKFESILKFLMKNVKKNNEFSQFLAEEFCEFFKELSEEWNDEKKIYKIFMELIHLLEENAKLN